MRGIARFPSVLESASIIANAERNSIGYTVARDRLVEGTFLPTLEEENWALEIFLIGRDSGEILVSTEAKHEGMFREGQAYFIEGKKGTYVQNPYYSVLLESAAMIISTPITNSKGELSAVLAARLDMWEISDIMTRGREHSKTRETYLVNKFNFFVSESRFLPDFALKRVINTEGVKKALAGENGVGTYLDYRGEPKIGVYRWLPELELAILTEIDKAEALAPSRQLRNLVGAAAIVTGLIVALMAFLFTKSITIPVYKLVEGTNEVGSGNLDYRIRIKTRDEIGQLAEAFNEMTGNLSEVTASRDDLSKEISERKRVEIVLRESKEELQTIYDGMVDGVLIIRVDNLEIVKANAAFAEMLSYPQEDLLMTSLSDFHRDEDMARINRMILTCSEKGAADTKDLKCLKRTGENVYADIGSSLITFRSYLCVACFYRDVTERKEFEDRLQQVAAGLAHEIRNPLNSIVTGVDLIARGDSKNKDYVYRGIREESRRIYHLLTDFLGFARPYTPRLVAWNINHVLQEIVSLIESENTETGVELELEADKSIEKFSFDRDRIRQVLWNIAINGIQSMPDGGVLKMRCMRSGANAQIEIEDRGTGIEELQLEHIFEPFYSTKTSGTGLGLAIALKIIVEHEGTIKLDSIKNQGTKVTVRLPIRRDFPAAASAGMAAGRGQSS